MIEAGVGSSTLADAGKAAHEASLKAVGGAGIIRADFAFVFATFHHASQYPEVLNRVSEVTGATHVAGCSTTGVLTHEGEIGDGPGIAVMAVHSDTLSGYPFLFHDLAAKERLVGHAIGEVVHEFKRRDNLLTLFPDPSSLHPSVLLKCIEEELPFAASIIGGCASGDPESGQTLQFSKGEAASQSLAGIYLTGEFTHTIGITQACHPVSGPLIVTRADGSRIEELRGSPALEHLTQILQDPATGRSIPPIGGCKIGIPVDPFDTELKSGKYIVRDIVDTDPAGGSIVTTEPLMEGQPLSFVAQDEKRAEQDFEEMVTTLSDNLIFNAPRLGLYFSSDKRRRAFRGSPARDIEILRKHFGTMPIIGFFTNGELAPINGINTFHNYSGVLTLISDPVE
jgi:small ligand-binding sensory domain FIST